MSALLLNPFDFCKEYFNEHTLYPFIHEVENCIEKVRAQGGVYDSFHDEGHFGCLLSSLRAMIWSDNIKEDEELCNVYRRYFEEDKSELEAKGYVFN